MGYSLTGILSVVFYVLQGLALQTIAVRRGIRHSWLAWVPVGSLWILGSICDDFRKRIRGKEGVLRYVLVTLAILVLVLVIVLVVYTMNNVLPIMLRAVSLDDLVEFYNSGYTEDPDSLYAVSQEEQMEELMKAFEEKLTEQDLSDLLDASLVIVFVALGMGAVAMAMSVVEYICLYNLFASCDPANKVLFLVLSIWLGTGPVFQFLCRNKDLGLPPEFPQLPQNEGYENYWQNQNNM